MRRPDATRNNHSNREIQTWEYRKWRKKQLRSMPLCVACRAHGLIVPATELDHIRTREALKEQQRLRYGEIRGKLNPVELPGLMSRANVAGLCFLHSTKRTLCQNRGGGPCGWDRDGKPVRWWHYRTSGNDWDLSVELPRRYRSNGW